MKKIIDRIFSKKGVLILGILTVLYLLSITAFFTVAGVSSTNPSAFAGKDFRSLRAQVISEGEPVKDPLVEHENYGGSFALTSKVIDGDTYDFYVSTQDNCSNYFAVVSIVKFEEYGLALGLTVNDFLSSVYQKDSSYVLYADALLVQKDGTPYLYYDYFTVTDRAGYFCSTAGDLILDRAYEDTWEIGVDQRWIDEVNAKAEPLLKDFFPKAKKALESFSVSPDKVFQGIHRSFVVTEQGSALLAIAAAISVIGGPVTVLFALGLGNILVKRKRDRLVKSGVVEAEEEEFLVIDPHRILEEPEATPIAKSEVVELPLRGPVERVCRKTHIRPVLGEWVVRGLGLVLITVGAVFMSLINQNLLTPELNDSYAWFKMVSALGQLLLVVALIGIIAETRKGLSFTASAFMALAITYYLAVNSVFFMFDTLIKIDFFGMSLTQLIASLLPGNLFMSMGLFTFIGFFLFEEPPEWLIKRRIFRALSALPTAIALLSVVLSVLWTAEKIQPNYWVSSFFFVRDFDGLIIGLIYIYVIFFFRSRLSKKYGKENVDDLMERPSIQFQKNMVLCLVMVVYTVVFYCLSEDVKTLLHLPDHTFVYALIPILLFYKPAGRHRTMVSNIVYYVLYGLSFVIPTIVTLIVKG